VVQVEHEDGANIVSAQVWLEPLAPNDVVIYSPSPALAGVMGLNVARNPGTGRWTVTGAASAEVYTEVLQSFELRNNGPRVEYLGSADRTVRFQVTDERDVLVLPRPRQTPTPAKSRRPTFRNMSGAEMYMYYA
jgi:hypothetical protein